MNLVGCCNQLPNSVTQIAKSLRRVAFVVDYVNARGPFTHDFVRTPVSYYLDWTARAVHVMDVYPLPPIAMFEICIRELLIEYVLKNRIVVERYDLNLVGVSWTKTSMISHDIDEMVDPIALINLGPFASYFRAEQMTAIPTVKGFREHLMLEFVQPVAALKDDGSYGDFGELCQRIVLNNEVIYGF